MSMGLLALGGALGALCRHWLGGAVIRWTGLGTHYGTFVVNILGCFLIGVLGTLVGTRFYISVSTRYLIFTGFLGAFTTFSTYMLENYLLLEEGHYLQGLSNMFLSVGLGLLALWVGVLLARTF